MKDAVGNASCQSGLREAKRPVERAVRIFIHSNVSVSFGEVRYRFH